MLHELLTRYGTIDRLWFDYWGDGCPRFGSNCPPGSFPKGYANITALVQQLSPNTIMLPGVDGCLDDTAVENGQGVYPNWQYASPAGNPSNPVVCSAVLPNSSGAVYASHEVDVTIQNPGDHWFWDASHAFLQAKDLFQVLVESCIRNRAIAVVTCHRHSWECPVLHRCGDDGVR